ncbi:MAG: hypothetical protein HC819_05600 [Cyclobacteriaceae bacterium]|nr:hypothetical protein [Cyclobacteriaceae bacterium]
MNTPNKPTTFFFIVVILALVWNLIGLASFAMDVTISPDALAALPADQRALYESTPMWLKVLYGLAVVTGTFGCILLLMKKSLARPILIISFVAVLVQMIYSLTMSKALEVYGSAGVIMPLVVLLIAGFLVWYANKAKKAGWLR